MADDEVKVLSDAKQLSFADRVAHKNWKVRCEAYEDINSYCQKVFSDEDPVLSQYGAVFFCTFLSCQWYARDCVSSCVLLAGPLFVKGVADTNAAALDKCLEALQSYLQKGNESHAARFDCHLHCLSPCQGLLSQLRK